MATPVILTVAHGLFLFLLINVNHAEDSKNVLSLISMNNHHNALHGDPVSSVNQWEGDGSKGKDHVRRSRDLKHLKSLKLRLEWFDKSTDGRVGVEYSRDLRNDGTVIEELGLSIVDNVNNGGYDVQPGWLGILQKYFKHQINLGAFNYQVAFDYREWWEDMRVITFELHDSPAWRKQNGNHYVNLTPDVSGEIVRAIYRLHGIIPQSCVFPDTMMRVYLLGTSIDCDFCTSKDIEFFPVQKMLNSGQPFEVTHGTRATKTRIGGLEILSPMEITFTFTVRVNT